MRNIEALLANWHRLYTKLLSARDRLSNQAGSERERAGLEAEVNRLQQESDAALHAVQGDLAAKAPLDQREGRNQREGPGRPL